VGWVGKEDTGLEFWKGSDIHRETITNPGFREVGVAAVPHTWGHIYIVVLGSRPDVLPALADPRGDNLFLTQDTFKFGIGNVPPMHIRLFDADGKPLNNGQPLDWAVSIPIPADAGVKFLSCMTTAALNRWPKSIWHRIKPSCPKSSRNGEWLKTL
jgi:hypothetical protein